MNESLPLYVGYDLTQFDPLVPREFFSVEGNAEQIEFSVGHKILFTRNSGSVIRVIDVATRSVIETRFATALFTGMSLTPDGNYLFAAD